MLDTSRWGTSTRTQSKPSGRTRAPARPLDHHEGGAGRHLVVALPGLEPGGGVLAEDREQVGTGVALGQLGQRVGGVARPAAVELDAARLQARHRRHRRLDEGEAVLAAR